jgi:HEAT repeat protein
MAWAQHNAPHKLWANMEGGEPRLSPEALQTASAALRKALGSSNASVRAQAAESLGQLGSPEAANLEALGKAVSDSEPQVQKAAAEALGQVLSQDHEIPDEAALDYLKPALASPNVEVRREAVGALRGLRGAAPIQAAVQMADDADPGVQREAIESLGDLLSDADAETAKASLPVLQKGLQSKDPGMRRQIVEALGGLHSIADQVVPLLAKAAEDPDPGVQREAVEALGRISAGAGSHKPWAHFVKKDPGDLHAKFAAGAR